MKKLVLSLIVVAMFAVYSVYSHGAFDSSLSSTQSVLSIPTISLVEQSPTAIPPTEIIISPTLLPSRAPIATTIPLPTPTTAQKGKYKDGSYTGIVADAFYGPLQVKTIISGGKISDVQFLQYPNDQDRSLRISQMSMPRLKSSAIQKQDSNVDTVSGATDTSQAFRESLASALTQAK